MSLSTLDEDFITSTPSVQLRGFLERCVPDLASNAERLLTHLVNLVGQEIEGEEVSLGLVLTPGVPRGTVFSELPMAAVSRSLMKKEAKIAFDDHQFQALRRVWYEMRSHVLGWVPGSYEQPVLVLDVDTLRPKSVRILRTGSAGAGEAYASLTTSSRTFAFWIKPAGSIRVYAGGGLVGQIMRLRDAAGWAARNTMQLADYIASAVRAKARNKRAFTANSQRVRAILTALIGLSEERKGAALYFVADAVWNRLNADRGEIAAKGKRKAKKVGWTHHGTGNLAALGAEELGTYLRQDGCVVFNERGKMLALGGYFRVPGAGGRRSTALCMARDHGAAAFVVSQDGGIYFYSKAISLRERHAREGEEAKDMPFIRLDFFRPNHSEHR